ncbi:hypothetical protein Enr13x_02670 [Stieleria neptunia]|uniref:Uncharacterized protein n=1 Tax=Stieleria neptunia TaxID=2527979 RepID=A0A518HHY4_9BACT|nr:hypothetical protein [Stieleria neptunia]QDV40461.1 hypothetical protein Enr13x_02670 [Stieleria neptunia]
MNDTPGPGWYRLFQKIALAIGLAAALLGFLIQNSAVWGAGLVILVHALIATVVIAVEDRCAANERG